MSFKNKITAFYAENFRSIKKGTWFELNKLNILTGANNSGKSTLFKAMKIFTDGFVDGDFPLIDIHKVLPESGYFEDLCNYDSGIKNFKLGFRYWSEKFNSNFEVIYQFVQGEKNYQAEFASVIISKGKKPVISLYSPSKYPEKLKMINNFGQEIDFKSVDEDNSPGEIVFSINLELLKSIKSKAELKAHSTVFDLLQKSFKDNWTGELFSEQDFFLRVHFLRISDELFFDFYHDYFRNLYNNDDKYAIFHDADDEEAIQEYDKLSRDIDYQGFIKDCFYELMNEVSAQIRFFYIKNLFHIDLKDSFHKRVISQDGISFRVPLITQDGYNAWREKQFRLNNRETAYHPPVNLDSIVHLDPLSFFDLVKDEYEINSWLKLFDLDGYIVTKEIENTAFVVHYFDPKKQKEVNIASLGKGHAQLIQLLLAIAYKIFLLSDEDTGKKSGREVPNYTILHIEEPEAYLHPKWQSKLADLFVMLSKDHSVQFLIETHSVYLIQKIQLLVARNAVSPTDISLVYFEESKKGAGFRKITIREDGLLKESFGEGFYDESAQLAIDLLNIENLN